MALVKTTNEILSISGRFGGVYFKKDNAGQHVQAMPRVVRYTRSAAQQGEFAQHSPFASTGIRGYSGSAAFWMLALLGFYGALWLEFALTYYFTSEDRRRKKISAYNWYIYYALAFPECERPPFWKPPHAPGELPDHICTFQGTWTYEHAPTDWPDYAPTGYYWYAEEWNGKPAYYRDEFGYALWWNGTKWVLSTDFGIELEFYTYYSPGIDINARYYNPFQKKYAHVYLGKPPE